MFQTCARVTISHEGGFFFKRKEYLIKKKLKDIYWFQRGEEKEREKDRLDASHAHPKGDGTCNLGMCSAQEYNPQPFGVWDDAPTNWATSATAEEHLTLFYFFKAFIYF